MRETSHLKVLPQTSPASAHMTSDMDLLLDRAGQSIGKLVKLRPLILHSKPAILEKARQIERHLPSTNVTSRVATKYAMLLTFIEMVGIVPSLHHHLTINLAQ